MDERMWIVVRRRMTVGTLHGDETWRTGLAIKSVLKLGKEKVFSQRVKKFVSKSEKGSVSVFRGLKIKLQLKRGAPCAENSPPHVDLKRRSRKIQLSSDSFLPFYPPITCPAPSQLGPPQLKSGSGESNRSAETQVSAIFRGFRTDCVWKTINNMLNSLSFTYSCWKSECH